MKRLFVLFILFLMMPFVAAFPGDMNSDKVVDVFDLIIVGSHFGLTSTDPGWDPRADSNGNGVIDIQDMVEVSVNIGNIYSCSADNECTSNNCECADAVCSVRVCNAIECTGCKYTTGGGGCSAGNIATGLDPHNACAGELACNGAGACCIDSPCSFWNDWYTIPFSSCLFKVEGDDTVFCYNDDNKVCSFDSLFNYARITGSTQCDGSPDWSPIVTKTSFPAGLEYVGTCHAKQLHYNVQPMSRPTFTSEIVMFEDTVRYQTSSCSLVYRVEGDPIYSNRYPHSSEGYWTIGSNSVDSTVGIIHPAQYDRATLQFDIQIDSGVPEIVVAHNGLCTTAGARNARPGLKISFFPNYTEIQDIASSAIVARISEALPRETPVESVGIAWDTWERWLRLDLPMQSYMLDLPPSVGDNNGGFGIRTPAGGQSIIHIGNIRVLWQDQRNLRIHDGYFAIWAKDGTRLPDEDYPAVTLPGTNTLGATIAIDLRREKALIAYGMEDFDRFDRTTVRGFAVRDLKSGAIEKTDPAPFANGAWPLGFIGGGLDGFALVGCAGGVPESLCWIDWNAYARGDLENFVTFASGLTAISDHSNPPWVGFHDPSNALDGSVARYVRITETWQGVNHLTYHPNLMPFVVSADVAMPPPADPHVSHTGPAGLPTQLVVRDRDRAFYETWAYRGGHSLHNQVRGYNLFSCSDDWQGPFYSPVRGAAPYEDYANMRPDLLRPGFLLSPLYGWDPNWDPDIGVGSGIEMRGVYWLQFDDGQEQFVQESMLPNTGDFTIQILR